MVFMAKFDFMQNELLKTQYHSFYLDGFFQDETAEQGIREAIGRFVLYTNTPIYIEPSHIIIGRLDLGLDKEVVTNTISKHKMKVGILEQICASSLYSEEYKQQTSEKFERMKRFSLEDVIQDYATLEQLVVEESGAALCQHYNGHMVMDYDFILSCGFMGLESKLRQYDNGGSFYQALLLTLRGMQEFIRRHGELASELLKRDTVGYDKLHLLRIIRTCESLADGNPPSSFYEGVQLQWFIMQFADYDSFGRYDQYLYPLYQKDIQNGVLNRENAKEYIKDMMRRVNDNGNIINMTIGGITPAGENAVNDLTYLLMEATRELGFKGPNLCLRIRASSEQRLWEEAAVSLGKSQALPALYNDDAFIPMLRNNGIAADDANNYCLAGCSQAMIPGKSNFSCDMGLYTPAKMLELALFDGYDRRIDKQVGPHTGNAVSFNSFEELLSAYQTQMRYCVRAGIELNNQDNEARREFLSCVRTLLTFPCIERGKGIFSGGAQYYAVQGEVVGLTNTANALAAIKKTVFEKKVISMEKLLEALKHNFAGYNDVRQILKREPNRYGNDNSEVDTIRADISKDIYREISSYSGHGGGVHWPGEVIFNYHHTQGLYCMASADGRLDYSVLADSAGPSQGTDKNGPTAILNSALKLPHDMLYTSINLNLMFDKGFWEDNMNKTLLLFKEYFRQVGSQLQINVLNHDDLLNALNHPDDYKGLVVRVGGYSAYFTQLSKELQSEIISRTSH